MSTSNENENNPDPNGGKPIFSLNSPQDQQQQKRDQQNGTSLPSVTLPKGGGALRSIGEKFAVSPSTGTATTSIPVPTSGGRAGFNPSLSLSYDSGAGNGTFGFGWQLSLQSVVRKTDLGLPRYRDSDEEVEDEDVFILAGVEDLVPVLKGGERHLRQVDGYEVQQYRPRIEGAFIRIERWTDTTTRLSHWRTISRTNITTIFGEDTNSRVFDPCYPTHIFRWLISRMYDDKGNEVEYEYKPEDDAGVDLLASFEQHRPASTRTTARYPKRIRYGNLVSRLLQAGPANADGWMFEVVFDYGEHDFLVPTPREERDWLCRSDPYSNFRSGFEVRCYRLCRRILMFHHFPDEEAVGQNCLVCSLDLQYSTVGKSFKNGDNRQKKKKKKEMHAEFLSIASCVSSVRKVSYLRDGNGGYLSQSTPPIEFEYSQAEISDTIHELDPLSLENLPQGLSDSNYQWLDLDGESVSGIMTQQGGAYFYKTNLGDGKFGATTALPAIPSLFATRTKNQQWLDLEGDGHLDVVSFDGDTPGFYKRNWNAGGAWDAFKPFPFHPNVEWGNSNLRFVDLTGDGKADILITNDEIFTWYPTWAEKGFGPAHFWRPPLDEDNGPRILLSDAVETIYLADMTGDGLSDLTRIRNGEISYWPNLGYGRFGSKVTMTHSPWFDFPDLFHQSRVRLADIDGSGTTDLLYLGSNEVKFYLNQAGNGWTDGQCVWSFPKIDDSSNVQVLDFLGRGTACLVWSSFLPCDSGRQLRYIDLMAAGKPYLLTKMVNNIGSETRISYQSSSHFYLQDKAADKQWMTRLPFPVQVVAQQTVYDRVSRNRFTTRFAYHEGYYDGLEREFRGFGMIETWDTEELSTLTSLDASNHNPTSDSPPVWTKTWYHTGMQLADGVRLESHLEKQYYREPGLEHQATEWLPHSQIPNSIRIGNSYSPYSLSPGDIREAYRALKGSMLRSETYSMDGSGSQNQPYSVHENNYTLELLQPRSSNQHAIFLTHSRESVSLSYERKLYRIGSQMLADPRVSHSLVLAVDEYANVLQSVSIGYGRRHPDTNGISDHETDTTQKKSYATYSLNHYTNSIDNEHAYLTPMMAGSRAYEILKLVPCIEGLAPRTRLVSFEDVRLAIRTLASGTYDLPFEDYLGLQATRDHPYRRLIKHERSIFRKNDFSGPLPLGKLESLAVPYQMFQLALSKEQVEQTYVGAGKLPESSIEGIMSQEGGYMHSEGDSDWWIPSSRLFYTTNRHDPPVEELENARKHFFTIRRARDPFDTESVPIESYVTFDKYDLQVQESQDSLGSRVTAGERNIDPTKPLVQNGLDYRLLQPFLVMDPNRNRSMVAFDVLGFVVGAARMGKPEEEVGDSLKGFKAILPEDAIREHFEEPLAGLDALLGTASTRFIYDYYAYWRTKHLSQLQPVVCSLLERETHVSDLSSGEASRIFVSFSYSDGFARLIQNKKQADPGPLLHGQSPEVVVDNRWIGSGWTIYNNKGSTIRKYEPFFTATHKFQNDNRIGVSPIMLYDPLQRVVATILPNNSWTKTVIDPWRQENWDSSDTVLIEDPKTDPDVGEYFSLLPDEDYLPTWHQQRIDGSKGIEERTAAEKTAFHANTPGFEFFDALGRTFLSIAMNRTRQAKRAVEEYFPNRVVLDIQGHQHELFDPQLRLVDVVEYNFLGTPLSQSNMENAQRWMLNDIKGKPIYTWDSREQQFRMEYDQLRRPLRIFLRPPGRDEILVERSDYGEFEPDPELHNVRGRTVRVCDQSGISIMDDYDFQGNLLTDVRKIAREYKSTIDWSEEVPLEDVVYTDSMTYDALNRHVQVIQPDGSISKYFYNVSGLLKNTFTYLQGSGTATTFVADTQYNAKGQRLSVDYGNDARTAYSYDPFTFRLTSITTKRLSSEFKNTSKSTVQDLHYTYDPTGNITTIHDKSQQSVFFMNHKVNPSQEYTYDALYRLVEARGREHVGQLEQRDNVHKPDYGTQFFHPHDGEAMARYVEEYRYDNTGNILSIHHQNHSVSSEWTKHYFYNESSLLEPDKFNNRLSSTKIGSVEDFYRYEGPEGIHGNITSMSRIPIMEWDYKDRLKATANYKASRDDGCLPQTTWYTYDGTGMRVRKVTENHCKPGEKPVLLKETIYIGGAYQIFRRYNGSEEMTLELETLSLMESDRLVALVETKTQETTHHKVPGQLIRYQLSNHQDSISLELGDTGQLISFEEYTPYGDTSYKAMYGQTEIPKLYRYTGQEKDDSGLYYNEARFYAPWIGRWINPDPKGLVDGLNLYAYARQNPVKYTDTGGTAPGDGEEGGGFFPNVVSPKPGLFRTWNYRLPHPPGFMETFHNVQRHHPQEVQTRIWQTNGEYNRDFSRAQNELTLSMETGTGYVHTALRPYLDRINAAVRSGVINNEGDKWQATVNAHIQAAADVGHEWTDLDQANLDRAQVSHLGTLGNLHTLESAGDAVRALPQAPGSPDSSATPTAATTETPAASAAPASPSSSNIVSTESQVLETASTITQEGSETLTKAETGFVETESVVAKTASTLGTTLMKSLVPLAQDYDNFVESGGAQALAGSSSFVLATAGKAIVQNPSGAGKLALAAGVAGAVVAGPAAEAVTDLTGSKETGAAGGILAGIVAGAITGGAVASVVPLGITTLGGAIIGGVAGGLGAYFRLGAS